MPRNKIVTTPAEAVANIRDGATIFVGGFGKAGMPRNLLTAVRERGPRNLTVVSAAFLQVEPLVEAWLVRKAINPYPAIPHSDDKLGSLEAQVLAGDVSLELVPLGTLVERIRCGGAGIAAFYTPTGARTEIASGKEERAFDGINCILEHALKADFALIKGHQADTLGNITFRRVTRNVNTVMATAAKETIVEVDEILDPGGLDPERVTVPGVFVHRVVAVPRTVDQTRA